MWVQIVNHSKNATVGAVGALLHSPSVSVCLLYIVTKPTAVPWITEHTAGAGLQLSSDYCKDRYTRGAYSCMQAKYSSSLKINSSKQTQQVRRSHTYNLMTQGAQVLLGSWIHAILRNRIYSLPNFKIQDVDEDKHKSICLTCTKPYIPVPSANNIKTSNASMLEPKSGRAPKFEACLVYIPTFKTARATQRNFVFKNKNNRIKSTKTPSWQNSLALNSNCFYCILGDLEIKSIMVKLWQHEEEANCSVSTTTQWTQRTGSRLLLSVPFTQSHSQ